MTYNFELKPLSRVILHYLTEEGDTAEQISERSGIKVNKINAAVTKSLVRYNLAQRRSVLSRFLKKENTYIFKTQLGVEWEKDNPITDYEIGNILDKQESVYRIPNINDGKYLKTIEELYLKHYTPPNMGYQYGYPFVRNFGYFNPHTDGFYPKPFEKVIEDNSVEEILHFLLLNADGCYVDHRKEIHQFFKKLNAIQDRLKDPELEQLLRETYL